VLEAAAHGVAGLTTEGVARRAGVNRATVYRRFGDRDSLIEAMTMREGQRMAMGIALAVARVSDPAEQFVEGFVASIRLAREHPIISRVASVEPEQLVAAGWPMAVRCCAWVAASSRRASGRRRHADVRRTWTPMRPVRPSPGCRPACVTACSTHASSTP
jgi:TetR/AcrR family transcriptional regulator, repressor for uid operon